VNRQRWWFSWTTGEDARPVVWPPDEAWLGFWCSGVGDDYASLVGWASAPNAEAVADLVRAGWPEWNGDWRIEPSVMLDPPGDRFPRPKWAPAWPTATRPRCSPTRARRE